MPGGLDMGKQHVLTALDMARGRGDYVVTTFGGPEGNLVYIKPDPNPNLNPNPKP